ncbi:mitochondrial carrier protein [Pseudohyphozyma bogoriensis]|nr:mitochondrial carrier protein [Pseudohyphozyma bogoriensis]
MVVASTSATVLPDTPEEALQLEQMAYSPEKQVGTAKEGEDGRKKPVSTLAGFSRALMGSLAFLFKRPIRLFRPVKISTWTGIQAIAEEQGRAVTASFVRGLIRKEGWRFFPNHVLPPLFINSFIGITLFSVYTYSESFFTNLLTPSTLNTAVVVPFVSGSLAGASQSLISAPLDNARLLLLKRQRLLRLQTGSAAARRARHVALASSQPFVGWWALLRDAVFHTPSTLPITITATTTSEEKRRQAIARAREWARRGWSLMGLSLMKDGVGFGCFFMLFECGRETAKSAGLWWDGVGEADEDTSRKRRSPTGLVIQSFLILVAGGVAGWSFSVVARPFERVRGAIWEGRSRWAEREGKIKIVEEEAGQDIPAAKVRRRKHNSRKRIVRLRGVGRTFISARRKEASASLAKKAVARRNGGKKEIVMKPAEAQQPLPSANSLVRLATKKYGTLPFLFAPRHLLVANSKNSTLAKTPSLDSSTRPTSPFPKSSNRAGPSRLSVRSRATATVTQTSSLWSKGAIVLRFLPPYSIGLLVYAVLSGDLA